MWLSDTSIKRPVLAIVVNVLLVVFGLVSWSLLSVRQYPDIDPPIVTVTTVYPGASADIVEQSVTEILEEQITSIDSIKTLTSESRESSSSITVEFELGKNMDVAAQEVRDRVARARFNLPEDAEDPLVIKEDADAQPVVWLSVFGENYSALELTELAERRLKERLQTVEGVSNIVIGGERRYAMRVWLLPDKMAARRVTVADIENTLRQENVELPSGRLEGDTREWSLKTVRGLDTPEAFQRLVIKTDASGQPVYLRDVANVEYGPETDRYIVRFNGKPAIGLGVVRQAQANTLAVVDGVLNKLESLRQGLPDGISIEKAFDSSTFIRQSIEEVVKTLLFAFVLVVVVIGLFLRNFRMTLIPIFTIPISLLASFILLERFGFSINLITLLALILAIGLVVDDAIIVLENIARHLSMGKDPKTAAFEGTREVGLAVIATTAVLVAIFLPLGYLQGTLGQLFGELAVALAGSVVFSGIAALTLAPVLAMLWLKTPKTKEPSSQIQSAAQTPVSGWRRSLLQLEAMGVAIGQRTLDAYERGLEWSIPRRGLTVAVMVVLMAFTGLTYLLLNKEFFPEEDQGYVFSIVKSEEGSTVAYTDRAVRQAEAVMFQLPEHEKSFSVVSPSRNQPGDVTTAFIFSSLKPMEERSKKAGVIAQELFPTMFSIPEASVFTVNPPSGPQSGQQQQLQVDIQGYDIGQLAEASNSLKQYLSQKTGYINVETTLKLNKPQLQLRVNRELATRLGISTQEVSRALQLLYGESRVTTFEKNSKRYDVRLELAEGWQANPDTFNQLLLRSSQPGQPMVPLSAVTSWQETLVPASLSHKNRLRSASVKASLLPMVSLGQGMDTISAFLDDKLPEELEYSWSGPARDLSETTNATALVFLLAIGVVYLVLAAQFESFKHPFSIMLTVPLALCGALITLFLFGSSLNIYSQIGLVLLIGLVTKNGILLVEYANQIHEQNPAMPLARAAIEAAKIRLRPILMTSVCTFAGTLPIALGLGAGGESRQPLGLAILGGLTFSTLLTLFIVPTIYCWISAPKAKPKENTVSVP